MSPHSLYSLRIGLHILPPNSFSDSPEVTLDASQREISTVEGGTVNVTCHVSANPPASVTWRHLNSGQVVSLTHILELPAISRNKAGRFVCEATNSLGTTQSEETLIDVKCESSNICFETYFNPLEYIFRRSDCYIS